MKIEYLAGHEHVIPTIARWLYDEWAYLHPGRSCADVEQLLGIRAQTSEMPLALVAFDGSEPLGTVSLKEYDLDTRLDLSPWLASLYVSHPIRRQGVGTALVSAIEKVACTLGMSTLYLYTPHSRAFYEALGWKLKESSVYHSHQVMLMEKTL